MRVNKSMWKIKEGDFGPLLPFIRDENVTDINYNGSDVWIDDLTRGRYCANVKLSKDFIERFTTRIADTVSATFNQYSPLLEAETDTLRISIVHEEYANTGRSISIRKTPIIRRLNKKKMLDEEYCSEEFLNFMEKCVKAKMNMLMCGLPGTGKTEFLKYLTSFIPAEERVITIEDNLEIHYSEINPGKDCVELKVDMDRFSYVTAIKACLRQAPQWILLSEARSTEVKYLLESMSTGTHCLTTIHTDDVRKVPDRIKNMVQDSVIAARIENDVFSFLDAAILVKRKYKDGKIIRYIDQMCVFSREKGQENTIVMLVEDGKFVNRELPEEIMKKFLQAEISDPLSVTEVAETTERERNVEGENVTEASAEFTEVANTSEIISKGTPVAANEGGTSACDNAAKDSEENVKPSETSIDANENQDLAENTAKQVGQDTFADPEKSAELKPQIKESGAATANPATSESAIHVEQTPDYDIGGNLLEYSYESHALDNAARIKRAKYKR